MDLGSTEVPEDVFMEYLFSLAESTYGCVLRLLTQIYITSGTVPTSSSKSSLLSTNDILAFLIYMQRVVAVVSFVL